MSKLGKHIFETDADDGPPDFSASLASEVLNALPVGILSWSANNQCTYMNRPALKLLELPEGKLKIGMQLADFVTSEQDRGALKDMDIAEILDRLDRSTPFKFNYTLPSDTLLLAHVRPVRSGGHVVTLSDQSEAQRAITAANAARTAAETAEAAATEILQQERARQAAANLIAQMDIWLQSCKTLQELFSILSAFMTKSMPGTRGQLFVYSNSRDVLEQASSWNLDFTQDHIEPDSCWSLRRGRGYVHDPDAFSFPCDHVFDVLGSEGAKLPFTCVPVIAHGETVGMLHMQVMTQSSDLSLIDKFDFVRLCAEHISLAIANVKLRDVLQDQSTRDPLTGLYNRRYFLESLRREINRAASTETSFALVSFDADHFKSFNDKYGHDAGDAVLESIAERMQAVDYENAVACRVGGEEFALILPGADRTRATKTTEDFRESIEDMRVKYIGGRLPKVTVSLGISIYPTHGTEPMDLIKQADLALYEAKEAGRNCWRLRNSVDLVTF